MCEVNGSIILNCNIIIHTVHFNSPSCVTRNSSQLPIYSRLSVFGYFALFKDKNLATSIDTKEESVAFATIFNLYN